MPTPWVVPERVKGLRRIVAIAVGEKHSVALQGFWVPNLPKNLDVRALTAQLQRKSNAGNMSPESSRSSDDGIGTGNNQQALSALAALARSPPACGPICCLWLRAAHLSACIAATTASTLFSTACMVLSVR